MSELLRKNVMEMSGAAPESELDCCPEGQWAMSDSNQRLTTCKEATLPLS